MSLYRIDGFTLSVNDITTWIAGFITLFRNGKLRKKHLPPEIVEIMSHHEDEKKNLQEIFAWLKNNEHYMKEFVTMVQEGMTDMAIEKNQ